MDLYMGFSSIPQNLGFELIVKLKNALKKLKFVLSDY